MEQVNKLLEYIRNRKSEGVHGVGVVVSFINRRVHPIKERVHLGYEFSGHDDLTRESEEVWTAEEFVGRLKPLFASEVVLSNEGCPLPYSL